MSVLVNLGSVAVKDGLLCHIDTEQHLLKSVAQSQRRAHRCSFFLGEVGGTFSSLHYIPANLCIAFFAFPNKEEWIGMHSAIQC